MSDSGVTPPGSLELGVEQMDAVAEAREKVQAELDNALAVAGFREQRYAEDRRDAKENVLAAADAYAMAAIDRCQAIESAPGNECQPGCPCPYGRLRAYIEALARGEEA